jgi:hypothetical protein
MLIIAVLVMLCGLILYGIPNNPKINEVGRIMFQVGLFFVLAFVGGRSIRL